MCICIFLQKKKNGSFMILDKVARKHTGKLEDSVFSYFRNRTAYKVHREKNKYNVGSN